MIDIIKQLEKGIKLMNRGHIIEEQKKIGHLRGGSCGCITSDNQIVGKCARETMLRTLGIQIPVELNRQLMFSGGQKVEEMAEELLAKSYEDNEDIKIINGDRKGCQYSLEGTNRYVSMRTDLEIYEKDILKAIVECKSLCGQSSNNRVYFDRVPDLGHLIQLGHYIFARGVNEGYLLYISTVDMPIHYATKKRIGTRDYKVDPFMMVFPVRFINGILHYKVKEDEIQTPITQQGILDYYKLIDEMIKSKQLCPRVTNLKATGDMGTYDKCKYCDLNDICDDFEESFDAFVDAAKAFSELKYKAIYEVSNE